MLRHFRYQLHQYTPCLFIDQEEIIYAIAEVHTELILIYPFREGNGCFSRMIVVLFSALVTTVFSVIAEVLFSENFDDQPDWHSGMNENATYSNPKGLPDRVKRASTNQSFFNNWYSIRQDS